jgi:sulfane dehydrogenase subunit SoxC
MPNSDKKLKIREVSALVPVAGNGLLHRRAFLSRSLVFAGASVAGTALATRAIAEPLTDPKWSLVSGDPIPPYQTPSRFADKVVRTLANPDNLPKVSQSRTPHHLLEGTVTPNGLHFSIVHAGIPEIDPDAHRFLIHGLVKRPLIFSLEDLARYPLVSRFAFIECGGNSAPMFSPTPMQANVQALHGLVSCAEWTGVMLSTLLGETGIDPKAKWFIAEGADAPHLDRSVPLWKGLDDAMIALYQNGEPLMPGNGYPMRLVLPGFEGNMQVKYLRRIKLVAEPTMSYYESQVYTEPLPTGKSYQFFFISEVKSFITYPSYGFKLRGPGLYQISGLAYSGNGKIRSVKVSADGGKTWGTAALDGPVQSKAFARFRMPWRWNGDPAILQSKATDEHGNEQPTRAKFVAERGELPTPPPIGGFPNHHFNAVMSWGIDGNGEIKNVYA